MIWRLLGPRSWRLHERGLNFWYWWDTRRCPHPEDYERSVLIDCGRRKMFWCTSCEGTWFS